MKLLSWIPSELLDFYGLSINPNAISLLAENEKEIHGDQLSKNINARELINKHYKDFTCLPSDSVALNLYSNPAASDVISKNMDRILNWHEFQKNPHDDMVKIIIEDMLRAIDRLNARLFRNIPSDPIKNILKNDYVLKSLISLAMNKNAAVIPVIERCIEIIDKLPMQVFRSESVNADHLWGFSCALSSNSNAIPLLRKYPRFIILSSLCSNENPEAADLIRYLCDKEQHTKPFQFVWNSIVCYERISRNPVMYDVLMENPTRMCIYSLCENDNKKAIEYLNDYFRDKEVTMSYVIHLVRNRGIQGFSERIKMAIIREAWDAHNRKKDHSRICTNLSRNQGIFE